MEININNEVFSKYKETIREQLTDNEGNLTGAVRFASALRGQMTDEWFFVLSKGSQLKNVLCSSEEVQQIRASGAKTISAAKGSVKEDLICDKASKKLQAEDAAQAAVIISEKLLPNYYFRQDNQKNILIVSGEESWFHAGRLEHAGGIISKVLNTTGIILLNGITEKAFLERLQLTNVYSGTIVEVAEGSGLSSSHILRALEKSSNNDNSDKKRLLIWCNWNEDIQERGFVETVAGKAVDDGNDVTLILNKGIESSWDKIEFLKRIPESVRLLYRYGGKLVSTVDEFAEFEYITKNLWAADDVQEALSMIDEGVLCRDCRRLFGILEFDDFIYFGRTNRLWMALSKVIKAKRKTRYLPLEIDFSNMLKIQNEFEVTESIFDSVVVYSEKMLDIVLKHSKDRDKYQAFGIPISEQGEKHSGSKHSYEGKDFYVMREFQEEFGNAGIRVLPFIGEYTLLADSMVSDLDMVLQWINDNSMDYKKLFLVNYNQDTAEKYMYNQLYSSIEKVAPFPITDRYQIEEYVKNLKLYITTDKEGYSLWEDACANQGIQIVYLDDHLKDSIRSRNEIKAKSEDYIRRIPEVLL